MTDDMTIGQRIAWYRRRRGLSQEVFAGLVGRTTDWLSKVENNRISLDRLSVIGTVAAALKVNVGDLIAESSLSDRGQNARDRVLSALRESLVDYSHLTSRGPRTLEPVSVTLLTAEVSSLWRAYQDSRFGYVTASLPGLLAAAQDTVDAHSGDERIAAQVQLALTYQLAATQLTKVGESELAWISADRGLVAASHTSDIVINGTLLRTVVHALLSANRCREAMNIAKDAAALLQQGLATAGPEYLSVYGTLFLAGSMAAARAGDAETTRAYLAEAEETAARLGQDANHLWTAFGPTNVAIHRVATSTELGDIQVAVDAGPRLDTSGLPMERRIRHTLEVARAFTRRNQFEQAQTMLLDAEQLAPEQVRLHRLSRLLVQHWMQRSRNKPSYALLGLASRLDITH